ncbi:hypothetical protein AAC387_Pa06g2415 [Persea americana]
MYDGEKRRIAAGHEIRQGLVGIDERGVSFLTSNQTTVFSDDGKKRKRQGFRGSNTFHHFPQDEERYFLFSV